MTIQNQILIIFIFLNLNLCTAQPSLIIHQSGIAYDSVPQLTAYAYDELPSARMNDSTLAFTFRNLSQPQYLFIVIDADHTPVWKTRVWIFPETTVRELFINYSAHSVTLKNEDEWDIVTDEFVTLIESGKGDEADRVAGDFVNKNPGSYLSLWFLTHGLYREKKNMKQKAFEMLGDTLEIYPEYAELRKSFSPRGSPKVGDAFRDFTLYNNHDSALSTSDISNKWILLHFWSNQCAPCVKEMDSLVSFYNSMDTSRIVFISVALDREKEKWKNSSTTNKIKWTSLWEEDNLYCALCLYYNVDVLPYFIIFDKSKKINLITFGDELELVKTTLRAVK